MRCLTPSQALDLDRRTFERPGYSSAQFIEEAGQKVFATLRQLSLHEQPTLILVGPGHNGADGRVVARELKQIGTQVTEVNFPEDFKGDFDFTPYRVVIDALFGVGLNRPIEGFVAKWMDRLNQQRRARKRTSRPLRLLAVDVPSGLDALTGWPRGVALRADWTVTFQAAKPGFFQNEGPQTTGRLIICQLPYPQDLTREIASTHFACGIQTASRLIPRRPPFSNKGSFGVVNVVAGSRRYPGAGVLCARAALRAGVGYVRLIQFEDVYPEWFEIPETLFEKWEQIPKDLDPKPTWVVGPGLDSLEKAQAVIRNLLRSECDKVVLDATALNALVGMKIKLPPSWILTPHPKELSRLLETSVDEIEANRFVAAERAHAQWGATVLLKGYKTIVHQEGRSLICLRGNVALAKAGSGDVLAGMIGALRSQGLSARDACVLGGLLHGITADLWLKTRDSASLNPSDMIELLPAAQKMVKNWRRDLSTSVTESESSPHGQV